MKSAFKHIALIVGLIIGFRILLHYEAEGITAPFRTAVLLGALAALCIAAYLALQRIGSRDAYVFFGLSVVIFTVAYSVTALNLNITASGIAVARVEQAAQRVDVLAEGVWCVADTLSVDTPFDGTTRAKMLESLERCRLLINEFLPTNPTIPGE